jgi:hypothetical protein
MEMGPTYTYGNMLLSISVLLLNSLLKVWFKTFWPLTIDHFSVDIITPYKVDTTEISYHLSLMIAL